MQSLKNRLNEHELDCIRFYMGDPEVQDKFQGGLKAYNTINALLHSGIQNELDLVKEGRIVEIFDENHFIQIIDLIISIYKSMIRFSSDNSHLITYKIDRYSSIIQMNKNQRIEGFFSTCKYGYLEEYAHIKKDVVLLEIVRDENLPYLDFEYLFKDKYAKKEESEILIPFDTKISLIEEMDLTDEEKEIYYDMNHKCPVGKYRIHLVNELPHLNEVFNESDLIKEFKYVQKCISNLMNHQVLNDEDLKFYTNWKEKLKYYLLIKIFE